MAAATAYMARKTAAAARATRDDADASQRSAKAAEESAAVGRATLDELQRGRQLERRPHLSVSVPTHSVSGDSMVTFAFVAKNLGRGPALHCVCVGMDDRRGAVSGIFEVGPGGYHEGQGHPDSAADQYLGDLFEVPGNLPAQSGWMTVCRDGLFGYWCRFRPGSVNPDVWVPEGAGPRWVTAVQAILPDLVR